MRTLCGEDRITVSLNVVAKLSALPVHIRGVSGTLLDPEENKPHRVLILILTLSRKIPQKRLNLRHDELHPRLFNSLSTDNSTIRVYNLSY